MRTRCGTIIMISMTIGFAAVYSGKSYAGSCSAVVAGVSTCSGVASSTGADSTQNLDPGTSLTVTTESGFGINTSSGTALDFTATGGLSFIDTHEADITSPDRGISAVNNGTGALSITTTGNVAATICF